MAPSLPQLPLELQPPPFKTRYFDRPNSIAEEWRRFHLSTQTTLNSLLLFAQRIGGGAFSVPLEDPESPDPLPLAVIPTPPVPSGLPPPTPLPWFDDSDASDPFPLVAIPSPPVIVGLPPLLSIASFDEVRDEGDGMVLAPQLPGPMPTMLVTTATTLTDFDFGNASLIVMNNATLATVTGLKAGAPGQRVAIISVGAGIVQLSHQDAGSAAANRLVNVITSLFSYLAAGVGVAEYTYDGNANRWRLLRHEMGAAITTTTTWSSSSNPQPAIGNGTITATIYERGNQLMTIINLTAGATTTFGTGFWVFSVVQAPTGGFQVWAALAIDGAGSSHCMLGSYTSAVGGGLFGIDTTNNNALGPAIPFAWGSGASLRLWGEFAVT